MWHKEEDKSIQHLIDQHLTLMFEPIVKKSDAWKQLKTYLITINCIWNY